MVNGREQHGSEMKLNFAKQSVLFLARRYFLVHVGQFNHRAGVCDGFIINPGATARDQSFGFAFRCAKADCNQGIKN